MTGLITDGASWPVIEIWDVAAQTTQALSSALHLSAQVHITPGKKQVKAGEHESQVESI